MLTFVAPITVWMGWSDAVIGDSAVTVMASVMFLLVGPVYGVVGAAIVASQPRNSIGWVLVVVAVGMSASVLTEILIPATPPEHIGIAGSVLLSLTNLAWVFFIFGVFHLMLTFPSGRPLSSAWRPLLGLEIVTAGFVFFTGVFAESVSAPEEAWTVDNPIGFIPDMFDHPIVNTTFQLCLLILLVGGVTSIGLRFRRSRGVERQQLKGLFFAVIFFAFVYTALAVISGGEDSLLVELLLPVALIAVGGAVGVAVLRYRLYEIDRFISRTVTYTLLVGLLASAVAALATIAGTRFESPLVVAATTLVVAIVFNPLRRRIQSLVDRRFNRSRYDAERVIDEFGRSLRYQTDPGQVIDGWLNAVVETMKPSTVGVWLR